MNVKKGDLAVVRTTHPMQEMHGTLVNVVAFMGSVEHGNVTIERVWHVDLIGQKRAADDGQLVSWGYIEDQFLFPIGGKQDVLTERTHLHQQLDALAQRQRDLLKQRKA